jgi:hypothetical protein
MAEEKTGEEQVERLLARRHRVTREELHELVKAARESGGKFVRASSFGGEDPDDWCGTMHFKGPRPKFGGVIDALVARGWIVEVFPYGIPVIDEFLVDIRNQTFGTRR